MTRREIVVRRHDTRRGVPHGGINSSGTSGYESRVLALDRSASSAVGTSHAWRCPSLDEATAYECGVRVVLAVAYRLRIERRVKAWRGGRDRISHTSSSVAR